MNQTPGPAMPPVAQTSASLSPPLSPGDSAELRAILDAHLHLEGALLPILHAVQAAWGHVPESAIAPIAATLNISRAELHGVISFYHDFRSLPAGRHVLRICRAEACQAVGAVALADAVQARLGVDWHGTTPDGMVTLEPVYCLGLCACGPAAMLDAEPIGRADADRIIAALPGVAA